MIYFTDTGDIVLEKSNVEVIILSPHGICKRARGRFDPATQTVKYLGQEWEVTEDEFKEFVWSALWALHTRLRKGH